MCLGDFVVRKPAKITGFTLLEVLISMAIIGVGLIALLTLFPIGLRSSRLAGDFTTASFIGQQALDNIRASAQVYDPGDGGFGRVDGDGLGYYELPISAVKGYFSAIRFPAEPAISQWWNVEFTSATGYDVKRTNGSTVGSGSLGTLFSSSETSFILYDNLDGPALSGVYNGVYDRNYDEFATGETIRINVEVRGGVPYYWYAMRSPVTEDQNLNGILEGRLPNGTVRPAPYNQIQEDTGLDLVPDFWDSDMRAIGTGTAGYQPGLDRRGEFTTAVDFPNDPHGDNRYSYDSTTGWYDSTPSLAANIANPTGSEGNGQIDAYPDDYIQKVTVTVGWREGGQDRSATFSASIANQFR